MASHRTDPERPLNCVDAVELARDLAEHGRAHRSPQVGQRDAQGGSIVALGVVQAGRELDDPRIGVSSGVDLASEDRRGCRSAADDRRVRPLEGDHLHVVVERAREDHEGSSVVAGHDAEDDRAVEVDDRAADLRTVLELQLAQGLWRPVEAREVGQHHERRLPLAALTARATFLDDWGKSVPAVHWSGPSAGRKPWRRRGRNSMPSTVTG